MSKKTTPDFKQRGRPLSPVLSKIILKAEEDNRQILTPKDFSDFYEISGGYARKMISNLVEAGWLVRVGTGKYQLQPAKTGLEPYPTADKFTAAGQLNPEAFIAFGSAAEYHGLTTQVFPTVTMATTKRTGVREAPPVRIQYVHLNEENIVGFQNISTGPNVKVATIERTLIDAIHRPDLCGGISDLIEIFQRGCKRANIQKLLNYLPTYHSKSMLQRVGFMLESFGCEFTAAQESYLQEMSKGNYAYLFAQNHPGTDKKRRYNSKWRLVVNAPGFAFEEKKE